MDAHNTPEPIRAEDLDRLADGSLTAADRRALLARINAEPDGWRRCALAFLEAQAWRDAMGTMTASPAQPLGHSNERSRGPARSRLVPMTVAAGLIGASFLLGRLTVGTETDVPRAIAVLSDSTRPGNATERSDPPADEIAPSTESPPWGAEIQAIGYLSMPLDGAPEAPVVELPVLAGPGIDDRWLRDQPSFVPEEFRKGWEELGYEVESQRRLVSVQIDEEGRYLTIPVDEVLFRSKAPMTY
ncbi:hypothetical protein AB1L88_02405 [Tautonia sp. JC769]|uniref:hypothetical protein n=1 Tax=Tautonia sp. JC769 TaxID=3232135 RepID=UPI00345916D6